MQKQEKYQFLVEKDFLHNSCNSHVPSHATVRFSQFILLNRILYECSCFTEFIKQVEEEIKCEALLSILSIFPNKSITFSNTGARMLKESIYHMTL